VQTRQYVCESPEDEGAAEFYDCGIKPISVRPCSQAENQQHPECNESNQIVSLSSPEPLPGRCVDASPICGDDVMMRYCAIPSYSELCCKSCKNFVESK